MILEIPDQAEPGFRMPGPDQIPSSIVAAPEEIPQCFIRLTRWVNLLEHPGAKQAGKLGGIPPIRLHPRAGTDRDK